MSDKIVIQTDGAPAPVGPYSQAVKHGNTIFLAGQIGLDPATGEMVGPDTASQIERIFQSIEAILSFTGLTLGHIVRCVVYLVDLGDVEQVNEAFARHFIFEPPARTTIQVAGLPAGARIEIEVTAMFPPSPTA